MVIYLDVLIIVNTIVDYFLLSVTLKLIRRKAKTVRIVLSVILGGVSSVYILADVDNLIIDFLYKLTVSAIMILIVIGFKDIKLFLKSVVLMFLVSCAYTGAVFAVYFAFKPVNLFITNSVIYFNISPVILVFSTVLGYIMFVLGFYIFKDKFIKAEKYKIVVNLLDFSFEICAIADTGNSVTDAFGNNEIIIVDNNIFEKTVLYLSGKPEESDKRYRVVPCSSVTGNSLLHGYRCDTAVIFTDKNNIKLNSPVILKSNTKLPYGFNAIINPEIL